jgi:hypothetical protein
MKLAEIAVTHILESVEDERCFSSVAFLKSKLRNLLDNNLEVVMDMFSQRVFTLETFPYDTCLEEWANGGERYRYALLHWCLHLSPNLSSSFFTYLLFQSSRLG